MARRLWRRLRRRRFISGSAEFVVQHRRRRRRSISGLARKGIAASGGNPRHRDALLQFPDGPLMSLLTGCTSYLALVLVIPLAIRLIRPQNAIPTIVAISIVIHLAATLAGAAWLGELDYWQAAAVYWFATVILI